VKKRQSDMTPEDMRRKGSWAVRFYGRSGKLPALRTKTGKPTRFALTAAAWGEPVPGTVAAARRIAAKGWRLLARYKRGAFPDAQVRILPPQPASQSPTHTESGRARNAAK
jgi:Domain of unknown function (DUF6321)